MKQDSPRPSGKFKPRKRETVSCEFLLNQTFCRAVSEDEEGEAARKEACIQRTKDFCCYMCQQKRSCQISCNYLDVPEKIKVERARERDLERQSKCESIEHELKECKEKTRSLATRFANGSIHEKSFLSSSQVIQERIDELERKLSTIREKKHELRYVV